MIGDEIEIVVLGIAGEQVKLGINAPQEIPVHRLEIYEQIRRENQNAAQSGSRTNLKAAKDKMLRQ